MRKLLLIAGALCLGNVAYTQITLSSSSYPASLLGTDSLKKTVYNSPFPSLAPMFGDMCDLTSLVDTTPIYCNYHVPAAGYDFADSTEFRFGFYQLPGSVLTKKGTVSIEEQGITVWESRIDLSPLTSYPSDSLFFDQQTSFYSTNHAKLSFPATIGSSWFSTWYYDINFEVSMAAFSLFHTPGTIRHYTTETNNVIGWGKMRVSDAFESPSDYLDILQVQTVVQTVDSYFLSGSPMPTLILTAFSLTQNKQDTTYTQNFYREQEVTPLAQVLFRDAGFTQPYSATTHVQRLQPLQVSDVSAGQISVFPNPLQGRLLTLRLPKPAGSWNYELINLSGAVVQSGNIAPIHNGALQIAETIDPGVYFLRLNDNNKVYSQEITITQ